MRSSYWSSDLCSSYLIARVFDDGCQDVAAAAHFLDPHDDLFGAGLGHRLDDGVLVREVVIDVADAHAGDLGNLRHAAAMEATTLEAVGCGHENLAPPQIGRAHV